MPHTNKLVIFQSNINYSDVIMRFVVFGVGLGLANLLSDVHSLGHSAKDGVLVVKPGLSMGGRGGRTGEREG